MYKNFQHQRQLNKYNKVNKLYVDDGLTIIEACEKVGICKQTYYNLRKKFNYENKKQIGGNILNDTKNEIKNVDRNNKFVLFNNIDEHIKETGIVI